MSVNSFLQLTAGLMVHWLEWIIMRWQILSNQHNMITLNEKMMFTFIIHNASLQCEGDVRNIFYTRVKSMCKALKGNGCESALSLFSSLLLFCSIDFLMSSSTTRLYPYGPQDRASDNFMCCHT